MSTSYGGINSYPTTIPIPSDGNWKNAATVGAALEGLMNGLTYIALIHIGTNPAGTFKNATLMGNTTIRNNGTDRTVSVVNVAITIDGQSDLAINGPASTSSTVTINRNMNWPTGNHTYGGGSGQEVSWACPTFFSQPMSLGGAGRLRLRRQNTNATSGNRSINPLVTDIYSVLAGGISPGDKGLVQNGTADGSNVSFDLIRIRSDDTVPFPLYRADAVTAIGDFENNPIIVRRDPTVAGEYRSVLLQWTGAYWEMVGQ